MTTLEKYQKYEKCRRNLDSFDCLVRTADPSEEDLDLKRFGKPFPQIPYLEYFNKIWLRERNTTWKKSRQMKMTWWVMKNYSWDSVVIPKQYTFLRSEKLGKAGDKKNELTLLGRGMFIINHLPEEFLMHCWGKDYELEEPRSAPLMMWRLPNGSIFHCISSNPDDCRGYNATGCADDEKASQQHQYEADAAMGHCLGVKGRWTKLSSVKGRDPFYLEWNDEE